jgi:peptidoglycan-associated lipoprotein
VILKQGLKLTGLLLVVALVAASGCRKKTSTSVPSTGPENLAIEDVGSAPGTGEETKFDDREVTEFGKRVASTLEPVMFKFDSAKLDDAEVAKADKVAAFLKDNAAFKVVIEGNCDERGTAEYNMALGERRAQAVRAYLLNIGVPETKIQTLSYGEEKPAAPGHAESDWSKNRRADFAIYE